MNQMVAPFVIDGRSIGPGHPPYVIAELSGNHNGDLGKALALIAAAKAAGADAVKLQTYTADTMTIDHHGPGFDIEGGLWGGKNLYQLYQEAQTPWDWHEALFAEGRKLGITVFSTPFDPSAVDFLESMNVPAFKIASFELVDLPLIERVARVGKPMILSSGMATDSEIADALATVRANGNPPAVLLHCVSGYPTPPSESNLKRIPYLAAQFGAAIGLSDHTLGIAVAVAGVAMGACVIEKHVTLARADGGPDAAFSLEPQELQMLVEGARTAWSALGNEAATNKSSEEGSRQFRRSLYVVADIQEGDRFTAANVRAIRPGFGLAPKHLAEIIGRRATRSLSRGTPLSLDYVEKT